MYNNDNKKKIFSIIFTESNLKCSLTIALELQDDESLQRSGETKE